MKSRKIHLLPIITIIIIFYIYTIIINDGILIFYGDSYEQVLQFYAGMWTKIHNGNIGFWDWSLGFGTNSFATVYYSNLNNIYLYLTLIFPKYFLPKILSIYPLIKLLLVYILSFHWLRKINRSYYSSIIGALVITFSGWVMVLFNYNLFLDTYPLYFLTLYLFENFLLNGKPTLTILSLSLTIITNFYNGYMFLPFFLAYAIYRYYLTNDMFFNLKIIKYVLKIVSFILIAVAISGAVLLPLINIVLQTPRLEEVTHFHFINLSTLYRFVSSMFIPVAYKLNPNLFINLNQYNGIGWSGGTSLFSLVLSIIMLPLLPFISNKKEKRALLFLFLLFFIILCIPTLYRLLQGTEETRWFYMFSIIVALSITLIMDDILRNKIKTQYLINSFVFAIIIFLLILCTSLLKEWYFDRKHLALFSLSFIFLSSVYTMFLLKKSKKFLIVTIVLEVLFNMYYMLDFDPPKTSTDISVTKLDNIVEYINKLDNSFYRIYFSENSRQVANSPYAYNYMASSFYSSLYNFEQIKYLRRYTGSWLANQTDGRIYNYNIESYKYWIGLENEIPPFGYYHINDFDDYLIYQNKYYQGLGFVSDETLDETTIDHLPFFKQDQLLQKYIFSSDSSNQYNENMLDKNVIQVAEFVPHEYFEHKLKNSDNGTMIFVENFAMENVFVEFQKDGNLVLRDYSVQQNYVGVYCPPNIDFDKIIVYIDDKYGYNSGINVYYSQNFEIFDTIYRRNNSNKLYDIIVRNDNVKAKINVDEKLKNSVLYTSIAYDSGWKAFVDGVETDVIKVNLGFVGLHLDPGVHQIEFIYMSPYFVEGCLISLSGIVLLIYIKYKHANIKN